MKIKRYFAADMRQAIRMVRDEQGPDAVILSNRRVDGGIELIAAVDYDAEMLNTGTPAAAAPNTEAKPTQAAPAAVKESVATPRADTAAAAPAYKRPEVEWSQDPAISEMRREVKALRSLLEDQLAHLAWGDYARNQPQKSALLRRLMALGLAPDLCRQLTDLIDANEDSDNNWRQAMALLADWLPVADDEILNSGGVVALVGPTGVGKTTTVAKLAARFALRHGARQVALISTDNYRIGAHEQLLTYGRILGVSVQTASDQDELHTLLQGMSEKKLVLIDTAGMSQRDLRLSEQLATLHGGSPLIKTWLVLSAATQQSGLDEAVRAFQRVQLSGCILTKVDEAARLGDALSSIIHSRLPLAYIGDGQRVPEDMHPARAHGLISRAVALLQHNPAQLEDSYMAQAFAGKVSHAHL
jgi:flagellar biosynthesis protein FlhF